MVGPDNPSSRYDLGRWTPRVPLRFPGGFRFPLHQSSNGLSVSREVAARAAGEALAAEDFHVLASDPSAAAVTGAPAGAAAIIVGERPLRGFGLSRSMRFAVLVVLGGGSGLGALDAIVVNNLVVLLPWVAASTIAALLLWRRYGIGYKSDIVVVVLRADAAAGVVSGVEWSGGEVRSEAQVLGGMRVRYAVRVRQGLTLAGRIGEVARRFEDRLRAAGRAG